jgi:hypothetical protein
MNGKAEQRDQTQTERTQDANAHPFSSASLRRNGRISFSTQIPPNVRWRRLSHYQACITTPNFSPPKDTFFSSLAQGEMLDETHSRSQISFPAEQPKKEENPALYGPKCSAR